MPKPKCHDGEVHGRLTVLHDSDPRADDPRRRRRVTCLCSCGRCKDVDLTALLSGGTVSCGCAVVERAAALGKLAVTHGASVGGTVTPTYRTWAAMRTRCFCTTSKDYSSYGGRGITVCPQWDDFAVFVRDMGERPGKEFTIDRVDSAAGYSPENCRWATSSQQNRNRPGYNSMVLYRGREITLAQLCDETGINQSALWMRLFRYGWDVERAAGTPLRGYHRKPEGVPCT